MLPQSCRLPVHFPFALSLSKGRTVLSICRMGGGWEPELINFDGLRPAPPILQLIRRRYAKAKRRPFKSFFG